MALLARIVKCASGGLSKKSSTLWVEEMVRIYYYNMKTIKYMLYVDFNMNISWYMLFSGHEYCFSGHRYCFVNISF